MTLDSSTQQELVRLLPRFRRFALGLTRNADAADDLVQTALEKAIARFGQWQSGTRLDSWVFRIIQTTHIDQIRSQKRREHYLEVIETQGENNFDGEAHVQATLTLSKVRRAIFNLSDDQRAVVMLVSVEGLTYREAADALNIPIGTLTSRLVRARNQMMQMLNAADSSEDIKGSLENETNETNKNSPLEKGV